MSSVPCVLECVFFFLNGIHMLPRIDLCSIATGLTQVSKVHRGTNNNKNKKVCLSCPSCVCVCPRILEGVSRIGGLTDGRGANVFDTVFFG